MLFFFICQVIIRESHSYVGERKANRNTESKVTFTHVATDNETYSTQTIESEEISHNDVSSALFNANNNAISRLFFSNLKYIHTSMSILIKQNL